MLLFALIESQMWREAVQGAVTPRDDVRFFDDATAAASAHRKQPASVLLVEWSAYPAFDVATFAGQEPPPIIGLVSDSAALTAALRAGASDCETEPSATRIAHRIEVALVQVERHRQVRSDAGLLRVMTSSAEADARLWEYDLASARFTRVHPEGASAHRYSADRIASLSWTDLYPVASQARVRDAVASCIEHFLKTGSLSTRTLDLEIKNADGSLGARRVWVTVSLDRNGKPTIVRGISWDTTELLRTRTSLATLGAGVASLLESLPVPLLTLRRDGTVLSWNPAARRVFGYEAAEVVDKTFCLAGDPDTSFLSQVLLPACTGQVQLDGRESVCIRKDGEPIHVAMWTGPIVDRPDQAEMVFLILADVDARKRAELEYRTLFEAAHDAILVFDPEDETILDVNARGCEIYGRTREEMIGASLQAFSSDPIRGREHVRETLESGALLRFETRQYRKSGEVMVLDVNASRITYRGRTAILSINRDVTARHAQEEELRKRDRALAEASKLEAVGRLAGGIAHDFNNLLMVVGGCSELITEGHDESSPFASEIADIESAFARAKALVRQLLTFAREGPTEVRTFPLLEVMEPLRGILRRLVTESVELVIDLDSRAGVCVRMDPSQLEQVLVNLVVNARDAISDCGSIHVAVVPTDEPGFVEIAVRDDGCGMDEATCARAFEPFFTTKELGRGTGLGLATAHGIVATAGGEIRVESELGKGSTFRVRLPITEQPPESVSSVRKRRSSRPGNESILLVEDEPAVRRILARELKRSGYDVLECDNGVDALDLVAGYGDTIDLLVTDVVMPKMGGDELARRLLAVRPALKVIFMSGHIDRNVLRDMGDLRMGPILAKPFGPAQLMEKVRSLFEA